jgi:hypothetical protein
VSRVRPSRRSTLANVDRYVDNLSRFRDELLGKRLPARTSPLGWSKYRIAQRLGITRRAVDEALTRPTRTPAEFLATEVKRNGGLENESDRRLKQP